EAAVPPRHLLVRDHFDGRGIETSLRREGRHGLCDVVGMLGHSHVLPLVLAVPLLSIVSSGCPCLWPAGSGLRASHGAPGTVWSQDIPDRCLGCCRTGRAGFAMSKARLVITAVVVE